jgi:hypothetical protein
MSIGRTHCWETNGAVTETEQLRACEEREDGSDSETEELARIFTTNSMAEGFQHL